MPTTGTFSAFFGQTFLALVVVTTFLPSHAALTATCGVSSPKHPVTNLTRIIGGNHAKAHSYPWAAALFQGSEQGSYQFCGGSLINSRWVLTAAHCFANETMRGNLTGYKVKLGADNKGTSWDPNEPSQQVVEIEQAFVNPKFSFNTAQNDTGLLKLAHDVEINEFVRPICLPNPSDLPPVGTPVTVIGWGITESGVDSPVLLQVEVPIVDHQVCATEYKSIMAVDTSMICAGYPDTGGKGVCNGDSGGPLMLNKGGAWYIEGTVSWGRGCAVEGYAQVYGYTASMMEWISATIKGNS